MLVLVVPRGFGAVDCEFIIADMFLALTVIIALLPPRLGGPQVVYGLLFSVPTVRLFSPSESVL